MGASDSSGNSEHRAGTLVVVRPAAASAGNPFETFIKITADGSVTAFNGHVDLGTGIRTALGQIVAEELDVSFARVVVVLGDTSRVPNQGATIASETIQITAVPLRKAAAQARQFLIARGAERLELPVAELTIEDGLIRGHNRSISYGELIGDDSIRLELADDVTVKPTGDYRIVGQSVPRVDLPAKATGELVYVHDIRVPGMLHGRVVRPPYGGVDGGDFVGTSLLDVDESSVRDIPGFVAVVRIADFVGVVAEREENAIRAASQLKLTWKKVPTLSDLKDVEQALRANPSNAAHPDRQGRCRCGARKGHEADRSHLSLALPDARLDRAVLRGGGVSRRSGAGLVGYAKPARAARRSRALAEAPGIRD